MDDNYSYKLVENLKWELGIEKDIEVCEMLPKMTSGNLSQVKMGIRHLTEEQALFIADKCKIKKICALIGLAAETAKTEKGAILWRELLKEKEKEI